VASELSDEGDFIEKYSAWFAIVIAIGASVNAVVELWRDGEPLAWIIVVGLFTPLVLAFFLNLIFLFLFHLVYYSSQALQGLRRMIDRQRLWRRLKR
jgi:hypothetical protein